MLLQEGGPVAGIEAEMGDFVHAAEVFEQGAGALAEEGAVAVAEGIGQPVVVEQFLEGEAEGLGAAFLIIVEEALNGLSGAGDGAFVGAALLLVETEAEDGQDEAKGDEQRDKNPQLDLLRLIGGQIARRMFDGTHRPMIYRRRGEVVM